MQIINLQAHDAIKTNSNPDEDNEWCKQDIQSDKMVCRKRLAKSSTSAVQ